MYTSQRKICTYVYIIKEILVREISHRNKKRIKTKRMLNSPLARSSVAKLCTYYFITTKLSQ